MWYNQRKDVAFTKDQWRKKAENYDIQYQYHPIVYKGLNKNVETQCIYTTKSSVQQDNLEAARRLSKRQITLAPACLLLSDSASNGLVHQSQKSLKHSQPITNYLPQMSTQREQTRILMSRSLL